MTHEIEHNGSDELRLAGTLTVRLAGELHRAAQALAGSGHDVVVRCGSLEHVDAAALQVLVALARALRVSGHQLTLVDAPADLATWARFVGLDTTPGSAG